MVTRSEIFILKVVMEGVSLELIFEWRQGANHGNIREELLRKWEEQVQRP